MRCGCIFRLRRRRTHPDPLPPRVDLFCESLRRDVGNLLNKMTIDVREAASGVISRIVLASTAAVMLAVAAAACTAGDERIVFQSFRDRTRSIYVMGPDGFDQKPLTRGATADWTPAMSPDGTRIAWASAGVGQADSDIYVMASDGADQRQLTTGESQDAFPSWSPDGIRIAYHAGETGFVPSPRNRTARIYLIEADGSSRARLTDNDAAETTPSWSPDGARIAFASNLFGGWDIHVIDIDGTDQERLTTSAADDLLPAWSPDGSRIAFVSNRDGSSEIYVVRLDGSQPERLTTDSRVNEISGVSWSPDGLSIAFAATRDADTDIFVFSLRDGKESQITTASGADLWPSWGPTGRSR